MSRRNIIAVATAAALALGALGGCAVSGAQSNDASTEPTSDPITVGLTFIPNVQFSPVYLADFSAVGAPVKIRHHGTDEGLFSALATGDEQVTVATGDEVLQARSQGLDVISVSAYYHHYPIEVVVPEDSSITTMEDLRGKRVGIPGEFGSNWFGLLAALDSADLTVSDIEVVSVGFTQAASLVSGEVDAIVGFVNSEGVNLQQMDFPSRSIALDPETTPLVGAAVVTTEGFAAERPDELRQVLTAMIGGVEKAIADPDAAVQATAKWDESLNDETTRAGARAVLVATIPLWENDQGKASGLQDLTRWENMGPFLSRILDEPALQENTSGAVTNEYVD